MMKFLLKKVFSYHSIPYQNINKYTVCKLFSTNQNNITTQEIVEKQISDLSEDNSSNDMSLKQYEAKRRQAGDLLKVFLTSVDHTTLENCIKCLFISVSFKIDNPEFLKKFEQKIIKKITDIEAKDLSKIIFGLFNLGYTSIITIK